MEWLTPMKALQDIAPSLARARPSVGKIVRVVKGRKHTNKKGRVFWHGRDCFASNRYKTEMQLHLHDIQGTYGFRVGIETETGERFFVKADYVEIHPEDQTK